MGGPKAGGAFVTPECLGLGEGTVDKALAFTGHVTRNVGNGAECVCVARGRGGVGVSHLLRETPPHPTPAPTGQPFPLTLLPPLT